MKESRKIIALLLVLLMGISLAGCGAGETESVENPDYAVRDNWAFFADVPMHDVDVFFVAPTSGSDPDMNMKMDDDDYKYAFKGATAMEKGIYDTMADFYAPYYRQVSLECYDLPADEREQYLELAYGDVEAAFDYYMDFINDGKPFILAGFSQGGDMIKRLLERCDKIDERMIAAYAIGWNFTEEVIGEYKNIRMAQGEDDLGVVVSFCSESPDYNGESIIAPCGTVGINPLNWKTDSTVADKSENDGACFTNYDGDIRRETPALCGAYLDDERGTLKVTGVTSDEFPAGLTFLDQGNYHLYDYQFFYRNLQENVETRIEVYTDKFGGKEAMKLDFRFAE